MEVKYSVKLSLMFTTRGSIWEGGLNSIFFSYIIQLNDLTFINFIGFT